MFPLPTVSLFRASSLRAVTVCSAQLALCRASTVPCILCMTSTGTVPNGHQLFLVLSDCFRFNHQRKVLPSVIHSAPVIRCTAFPLAFSTREASKVLSLSLCPAWVSAYHLWILNIVYCLVLSKRLQDLRAVRDLTLFRSQIYNEGKQASGGWMTGSGLQSERGCWMTITVWSLAPLGLFLFFLKDKTMRQDWEV